MICYNQHKLFVNCLKKSNPTGVGEQEVSPRVLELTVALQTGGDLNLLRGNTFPLPTKKKKKKNQKKHSKHILGLDGMFTQLTSQNRISLCFSQCCKGNSLYEIQILCLYLHYPTCTILGALLVLADPSLLWSKVAPFPPDLTRCRNIGQKLGSLLKTSGGRAITVNITILFCSCR